MRYEGRVSISTNTRTIMKKRKGFYSLDSCYDEICNTKCTKHPSIFIGSFECYQCKEFVKEDRGVGFETTIVCKN